jgi:hypothetical protein
MDPYCRKMISNVDRNVYSNYQIKAMWAIRSVFLLLRWRSGTISHDRQQDAYSEDIPQKNACLSTLPDGQTTYLVLSVVIFSHRGVQSSVCARDLSRRTQHNVPDLKILTVLSIGWGSWDSVVGIATGYELDDGGVGVRALIGSRMFSTSSRPALGPTQPPIQWVPGVKRPGREADRSSPTTAEVKKIWIYTSFPHTT